MKLNRIPLIYKAISIKIKQFFINIDMFWINFSYCDLANLFALGFFYLGYRFIPYSQNCLFNIFLNSIPSSCVLEKRQKWENHTVST